MPGQLAHQLAGVAPFPRMPHTVRLGFHIRGDVVHPVHKQVGELGDEVPAVSWPMAAFQLAPDFGDRLRPHDRQ